MSSRLLLLLTALPLFASPEAAPKVRVLILEKATAQVEVDGPYVVTKARDASVLGRGPSLKAEVAADKDATRVGTTRFTDEEVDLVPAKPDALVVEKKKYAGALRLARRGDVLLIVNVVELEDYVAGVIGAEIGADSAREALAAQAIISRGYGVRQVDAERQSKARRWFDVYDDTRDQVYAGLSKASPAVRRAVDETRGQVLLYQGRPFVTYFSSTCGGHTEPVEEVFGGNPLKPLSGVECPWCAKTPKYDWTVKLSENEVRERLAKAGHDLKDVKTIEVSARLKFGRVKEVKISSSEKTIKVTGKAFREALDGNKLLSTKFDVRRDGDTFVFTGHGWGHGVGLCQEGALKMAEKGKKAAEILEFYYPGAQVVQAYAAR